ncbi:peptidase [Acidobacteriota bacterium]
MHLKNIHGFPPFVIIFFLLLTIGFHFGCKGKTTALTEKWASTPKVIDIQERLAQFIPTEISYDESLLNDEQTQVLEKLILAAKQMDKIFWKQASHTGLAVKKELEEMDDPSAKDFLKYLEINFGPYDRLDENNPFIGEQAKSPGAGFYPADMTSEDFLVYITSNPEKKEELEDTYTVVKREDSSLFAVPYNEEYREDLEPAVQYLKEAAGITTNASLKKFLNQRAADLLSNDYYQSDSDWIDLKDNLVEIVIGPFEVYEDALNGLKAAYEAFVYINDFEEMEKIKGYLKFLDEMQKTLPVAQKYKDQDIAGLASPLNVAIEVFTAGDTKSGVQTLAFVLPNDERIREEKGTKKVFLKNVMEAKFNQILVPISKKVLSEADAEYVSFWAYFNEVVLHEICHALGVNYVTYPDGTKTTVNKALKENYSAIEEAKATVVGLQSIPLLIEKGWIPADKEKEIYTTYLAGMFRSMRFGLHEAHGMGTLLQYNFLREQGGFVYDENLEQFHVDENKIRDSITKLAQVLLILEGDGNYENVAEFLERYGHPDALTENMVAKLNDIPVDIAPEYKF